ncbi:MAG TPA: ribonuclease III [Devosiaceae bacterium]
MIQRSRDLEALQQRLGYSFRQVELLERALTHSSAISPAKRTERSYQRLEFLGDRVLGLVIADLLHRSYPKANEGDLSRSLNSLVRKENCAAIARGLELGRYLRLGESEARTGGAEKDAILADVTEAVIGAIFCDGGFEPAYGFVERVFATDLQAAIRGRADAKTTLQEWAQGRGLEPPSYVETGRSGPDHAPVFTISVIIEGFAPLAAEGTSKKLAEHKAAEGFLLREAIWKEPQ